MAVRRVANCCTPFSLLTYLLVKALTLQSLLCVEAASSESSTSTAESSTAAQLLTNTMYPTTAVSSTAAVRQISPSTPIVLSAEQLTALLTMNTTQQQQQAGGQSQPTTPSVELGNQILQYITEQAAGQAMTLSMDSVNIPAVTELSGNSAVLESMSNDLDVGAQEVLEEGTGLQKQHPLHLN